ncbi:MAG: hypothetical protein JSS51_10435 [Planctomycetes bacterium]|nr:hypothetical protein [Planctomycetota bacterium]
MNLLAVLVAGYAAFSLELGLRNALAIGSGGAAPSFVFVLCVILAVGSPANLVLWTCLTFGLITDLTWPHELKSGTTPVTIIGPYALGYLTAGQFILLLRSQIFKRNPLSLAFLCAVGFAVAQVVVVAIYTFRSPYTHEMAWEPTHQLLARLVSALYTGLLGLLVGLVAGPLSAALGLHQPAQRRYARPIY